MDTGDTMTPADWEQWMLTTEQAPVDDALPDPEHLRLATSDGQPVGDQPRAINATPFEFKAELDLPKREWLYGHHLIRGRVSLDVAAGGVGKTALSVGDALAMAAGRDLYNKPLPCGPLRVWLYNLEDDREELQLRIQAAAKFFNIRAEDIADRLYVDSGLDQPCVVAQTQPSGTVIMVPTIQAVISNILERQIDVFSLDPFVSAHNVSENDNGAIDIVVKRGFVRIAHETRCSVRLFHHIRKANGEAADADSARGASALIGAARSVHVYNRMTEAEADKAKIDASRRKFYFRVTNEKANLAPPPERADWYEMKSVELDNGEKVGVAAQFIWPAADDSVTRSDLRRVQEEVARSTWRADYRCDTWVGHAVATALGFDTASAEGRKEIKALLKTWISNGALREVDGRDHRREKRLFVEVGEWVSEAS